MKRTERAQEIILDLQRALSDVGAELTTRLQRTNCFGIGTIGELTSGIMDVQDKLDGMLETLADD